LTWALFAETHPPEREGGLSLARAFANVGAAFAPGRLRPLFVANGVLYLAIFGFFRVYPMYLVDHFDMGVSRESEFVAWVAVPIVIANLGLVSALAKRMRPRQLAARFAVLLAFGLVAVVVPDAEGWLWVTLAVCALALAVCLPSMAAMISTATSAEGQGSVLGANQSLQVGAEAVSGVGGGALAAISTTLPLPVLGGAAALAAALLGRPAAREATEQR
jgi:predicted MFS family arabinose efflux permease